MRVIKSHAVDTAECLLNQNSTKETLSLPSPGLNTTHPATDCAVNKKTELISPWQNGILTSVMGGGADEATFLVWLCFVPALVSFPWL